MPCFAEPAPQEMWTVYEERLRHDSPTAAAEAFCELCRDLERRGIE
jgi:hypothetical protein